MPRHRSKELQVVRCISLLIAMARARRGVNLRQFAERRGWNWRAVYRDVESLRAAGVPVEHQEHGWFGVAEHWIPSGTVDVTCEELLALFVARHFAPGLKDTRIGRALDGLWSKLSTPGRQPPLAFGDETWLNARVPASIDYGPHQQVLDCARDAIRQRRALHIQYRTPDGVQSERVIEPAFVRWDASAEALYVVAWCRMRETLRTFAVHRIVSAQITAEDVAPRREAVAEMNKAFRLWLRPKVEHVLLRFSPRVAGEVRERRWHATEHRTELPDGGIVVEMDIAAPEELERWLLGYGADVHVEEPAELAERIRQRHADACAPERFGALRARTVRGVAPLVTSRRGSPSKS